MAFLDENGLAELWSRVKEEDNKISDDVKDLWRYAWERAHKRKVVTIEKTPTVKTLMETVHTGTDLVYAYGDTCVLGNDGELSFEPYEVVTLRSPNGLGTFKGKYFKHLSGIPSMVGRVFYAPPNAETKVWTPSGYSDTSYKSASITSAEVTWTEETISRNYEFTDEKGAHTDVGVENPTSEMGGDSLVDVAEYDIYYFLGSVAKNSLSYYKLNVAAVLDALLGLEGITYE